MALSLSLLDVCIRLGCCNAGLLLHLHSGLRSGLQICCGHVWLPRLVKGRIGSCAALPPARGLTLLICACCWIRTVQKLVVHCLCLLLPLSSVLLRGF